MEQKDLKEWMGLWAQRETKAYQGNLGLKVERENVEIKDGKEIKEKWGERVPLVVLEKRDLRVPKDIKDCLE